jgi:alpha-glucoside transport system permease protein
VKATKKSPIIQARPDLGRDQFKVGRAVCDSLGSGWQLLTAAAFISMMLPLIIFFALQRYFVRGILAGSVKG